MHTHKITLHWQWLWLYFFLFLFCVLCLCFVNLLKNRGRFKSRYAIQKIAHIHRIRTIQNTIVFIQNSFYFMSFNLSRHDIFISIMFRIMCHQAKPKQNMGEQSNEQNATPCIYCCIYERQLSWAQTTFQLFYAISKKKQIKQ